MIKRTIGTGKMGSTHRQGFGWAMVFLGALFLCGAAGAQDQDRAKVRAELSRDNTSLDRPVELRIICDFDLNYRPTVPETIEVDGLRITLRGQSTHIGIDNFRSSLSRIYSYLVEPETTGTFEIPSLEVQAGGHVYHTEPLELEVSETGEEQRADGLPEGIDEDAVLARILLRRSPSYVGEVVPAEIRFYFDTRLRPRNPRFPVLEPDRLMTYGFDSAFRTREYLGNRAYEVFVFKTAVSGIRPGTAELGPIPLDVEIRVPDQERGRIGDFFGRSNIFDDDFFSSAFGYRAEQITVEAPLVELEILALPEEDRPDGFSGAVGQFELFLEQPPESLKIGEPATVKAFVEGTGSFDRLRSLTVHEEAGWRSYPPSSDFRKSDNMGISGVKEFEYTFVPEDLVESYPELSLSYFDPQEKRYVTLRPPEIPVLVEGTPTPTPAPEPEQPADVGPAPAMDQLVQIETPGKQRSLENLLHNRVFWAAQSVPLAIALLLLGSILARERRRRPISPEVLRERERQTILKHLEAPSTSALKQLRTIIEQLERTASERVGRPVRHTGELRVVLQADAEDGPKWMKWLDRYETMAYAGAEDSQPLSEAERKEVTELLERFFERDPNDDQ